MILRSLRHHPFHPLQGQRSGVAATELAFILPLLVMLLVGVWEYGRLIHIQQIVDNAAREGGRQASSAKYTKSEIQQVVLDYLTQANVDNANTQVTVTNVTTGGAVFDADQGDQLLVEVSFPFSNMKWLLMGFFLPENTRINSTASFQSMKDFPVTVPVTIPQSPLP